MVKVRNAFCLLVLVGLAAVQAVASSGTYKGNAVLIIKPLYVESFKQEVRKIIPLTRAEAGNISYQVLQVLTEEGEETNRFEFMSFGSPSKLWSLITSRTLYI